MKPTILALFFVLAIGSNAWAGSFCNNFTNPIFCDDFDSYCDACSPPFPSTTCTCALGSTGNRLKANDVWVRSSVNYHVAPRADGSLTRCGAEFDIDNSTLLLTSQPFGGRENNMGDENGDLGQQTASIINGIHANFGDLNNMVLATDESPLVLQFNMSGGLRSAAATDLSNGYLELAFEDLEAKKSNYIDREVTPTDYIKVGVAAPNETCLSCYTLCQALGATNGGGVHTAWPTVCQSYDARSPSSLCPNPVDPTGPMVPCGPPYCPPVPADKIHNTIAIGALAWLDTNPCHCEFPPPVHPPYSIYHNQGPKNPHLAFFDGWKWRALREGNYGEGATGHGDFLVGDKYDIIRVTIRTTTIDIFHQSRQYVRTSPAGEKEAGYWEDWAVSEAFNVPRKYLGGFNVVRSGTAPNCELKDGVYDCKNWAATRCFNMTPELCTGGSMDDGANYIIWDDLALTGGKGETLYSFGACCIPPTGSCEMLNEPDCLAVNGRWAGANKECTDPLIHCCPTPWADTDHDRDVDADDFALLQRCVTIGVAFPIPLADECKCFDRGGDQMVDITDLDAFVACATGAAIVQASVPVECAP